MLKRSTIRILLINQDKQLLLMRVVDPTTTGIDKKSRAAFWCTIGGTLEIGESIEQAAYRELYEETGLIKEDIILGPIVWHGNHEMIIRHQHVELDEKFIVAHLNNNKEVTQDNFTDNEKFVVTHLKWLSLADIINNPEPIFPAILKTELADILNMNYPVAPKWVDLALQP